MDLTQGKLHLERGHIDEAATIFMQALSEDFNNPEALFLLASCFLGKDQYGTAANLYKQCLDIKKMPEAMQNLGACYKSVNKTDEAEQIWELGKPLATTPRMLSQFHANIGGCYVNNNTPDIALKHYQKALEVDPTNLAVQFNMGLAYLEKGDWKEGFGRYDMGFPAGNRSYRMYEGVKPYKGGGVDEITDRTVIVWGDQGIGDEIMFASCIPDLIKDAKKVIFDCHPRLVTLFERAFGIECHGTRKTQMMDWHLTSGADVSIPLSTLATIYRSNGEFPSKPYIYLTKKDPCLPMKATKPRIGISWIGGVQSTRKDLRSMPLLDWEDLIDSAPWADWYSFQYTDGAAKEVAEFEEKTSLHVRHFPGRVQCDDYATTCEFVREMDLIITVCTSIIHAAGSQGVPCFVLTPSKPVWTIGMGEKMPWYDSVTLFRQPEHGDWKSVFQNVKGAIHDYLNQ